jgi:hypothetical protein
MPHPELCEAFYMCAGGVAIPLFCTEGLEFDPELKVSRTQADLENKYI